MRNNKDQYVHVVCTTQCNHSFYIAHIPANTQANKKFMQNTLSTSVVNTIDGERDKQWMKKRHSNTEYNTFNSKWGSKSQLNNINTHLEFCVLRPKLFFF